MTTLLKMKGVTLPGAGYPNINDFVAPVFPYAAGLVGLYTFGSQLDMSLVNHVNGALPPIPYGALSTGVDGVVVSRTSYLDTQLPQDAEYTVIALCLPILATSYLDGQLLFNNYKSGDAKQGESVALSGNAATSVPSFGAFLNAPDNAVIPKFMALPAGMSTSRHAGFGVRVSLDGSTKCFVRDKGVVSVSASAVQGRMSLSNRTMLIGAGYTGTRNWNGNLTVKLLAVWSTPLTDQQITENLSYLESIYPDLMNS